jgi:hypothetical protein|tara:strand:+ start:656 stop:1015 length:360 start_codon:yes stop_codon:yes gene_type:complete
MRSVFSYKTKEEFASEKAEFESYLNYFKQVDPDNYKEWFDEEVYRLFAEGRMNPHFFSERQKPSNENVSMVRVPTRCPLCKKAWAIEMQDNGKFEPGYLDQSVYKTIPMIKGVCHKCKD